jgi:hypothetical protein
MTSHTLTPEQEQAVEGAFGDEPYVARLERQRQRISSLEGLLREAVACVEIVERRDMGGQEWLDARRLRLRIEAELAGEGERHGE